MKKTHDLLVVVGTYKDREGNPKNRYQTIGSLFQGDKGPFILLDRSFNPAGVPYNAERGNQIMVSAFEPRGNNQSPTASDQYPDDIPF